MFTCVMGWVNLVVFKHSGMFTCVMGWVNLVNVVFNTVQWVTVSKKIVTRVNGMLDLVVFDSLECLLV